MDNSINVCPWEPIRDFQSLIEFEKFERWMSDQIRAGRAEEIPIEGDFKGIYPRARWFSHKNSGQVWRLAGPDGPFHGTFEPLVLDLLERFCYLLGQAGQDRWSSAINDAIFALRESDFPAGYEKARTMFLGLTEANGAPVGLTPEGTAELKSYLDKIAFLFRSNP
jgi:hypothetical protein